MFSDKLVLSLIDDFPDGSSLRMTSCCRFLLSWDTSDHEGCHSRKRYPIKEEYIRHNDQALQNICHRFSLTYEPSIHQFASRNVKKNEETQANI